MAGISMFLNLHYEIRKLYPLNKRFPGEKAGKRNKKALTKHRLPSSVFFSSRVTINSRRHHNAWHYIEQGWAGIGYMVEIALGAPTMLYLRAWVCFLSPLFIPISCQCATQEAVDDALSTWIPITQFGNQGWDSQILAFAWHSLAIVGIWRVNQDGPSLSALQRKEN